MSVFKIFTVMVYKTRKWLKITRIYSLRSPFALTPTKLVVINDSLQFNV